MALGPDGIIENMQKIADESELAIDNYLLMESKNALLYDSIIEINLEVGIVAPNLTQDIWNCMLRKKYIIAGWSRADWVMPLEFDPEPVKLKFVK